MVAQDQHFVGPLDLDTSRRRDRLEGIAIDQFFEIDAYSLQLVAIARRVGPKMMLHWRYLIELMRLYLFLRPSLHLRTDRYATAFMRFACSGRWASLG